MVRGRVGGSLYRHLPPGDGADCHHGGDGRPPSGRRTSGRWKSIRRPSGRRSSGLRPGSCRPSGRRRPRDCDGSGANSAHTDPEEGEWPEPDGFTSQAGKGRGGGGRCEQVRGSWRTKSTLLTSVNGQRREII